MRRMPRYEAWSTGTSAERIRIARGNLRDNPLIAAYWCEVLHNKFNVVDDWYRYEWQGRGSSHCHGTYWSEGAPDPEDAQLSDAAREAFAKWWGIHITAVNPEPGRDFQARDEGSAISLPHSVQDNNIGHLSAILNRVQRHHCSDTYCLRKEKRTGGVFPVTIAYAITVHKAQGITVEQAVLNITDRDFAPGLTYVATSRVKSLYGLLFEESFDFERFRPTESATSRMRKEDIARRRHEHYGCLPVDSSSPAPISPPLPSENDPAYDSSESDSYDFLYDD
ncbi:hypothetical protein Egran_04923 [Elaphomyces granulatus]|uniref:Helitron helicase-like domain-containing protein n=1 Tax=Elaphomyces granulatus TaxID=519963 RepID=A0A232LT14_9EURO|nr:hypothetical protein Egran_04923 [Elaphomyces granulatus]